MKSGITAKSESAEAEVTARDSGPRPAVAPLAVPRAFYVLSIKAPLCVVVTHFTFWICPAQLENFILGRSVGQAHRRRCPVAP